MPQPVTLTRVDAARVLPLRAATLRADHPVEEARFEGDEAPHNAHFAVTRGEEIIGVGSVLRLPPPGRADPRAWRVRGMAVAEGARGQGIGQRILMAALTHAAADHNTVWCYARVPAINLYLRAGFAPIGEVFELGDHGPHLLMMRAPGPI
ncbi:GNAT family N-acetyltransferase [Myxococcota bacterium]|nr:GNAT family N-acetyltransferase [Myxococcota bacterium]